MDIPKTYNKHKSKIRYILFLLGLFFLAGIAINQKDEISPLIKNMDFTLFGLSILIGLSGNIVQGIYFSILLNKHGQPNSKLVGVKIFLLGQIAKYIPGKIWALVLQDAFLNGKNSTKSVILANVEMMLGLAYVASALTVTLIIYPKNPIISVTLLCFGSAFFLMTSKTHLLTSRIKLLRKLYPTDGDPANHKWLSYVLIYFSIIVTNIFSNALLLNAIFQFSFEQSALYIAILSASWIIGVLAFIFPAGIGIREIAFVFIASQMLSEFSLATLTSIAVIIRFWQIIQEVAGAIIASALISKH